MIVFYLIVIAFLILFPADTAYAALEAMRIWCTGIVPTLFPYMIVSRLLCKSLLTINLPAEPAAAILGLLGGSPSGASVIASHADRLASESIYPLCALAGTISPMFILGTMQTWIGDAQLCRQLLICHWISAILCAWLIWILFPSKHACTQSRNSIPSFSNPIALSIDAILQVGGCIICYSVLSGILRKLFHSFQNLLPYLHAALEISGGIHALCQHGLPEAAKSILLSATLGFGGLSILSQNHAMLRPIGIPMRHLLAFAGLRAMISAFLMTLCTFI